jgi:hypothetical protein
MSFCPQSIRGAAFSARGGWFRYNSRRLTRRAADDGYAARFLAFCATLRFFRFGGESTLPPIAANAHR